MFSQLSHQSRSEAFVELARMNFRSFCRRSNAGLEPERADYAMLRRGIRISAAGRGTLFELDFPRVVSNASGL